MQSEIVKLGWGAQVIQVCNTLLLHLLLGSLSMISLNFRRQDGSSGVLSISTKTGTFSQPFCSLIKLQDWNPLMVFEI